MPEIRFRTREIALSGRLRTADDPATIGPNDLAICKNMRPWDQYPRGIGGMTKINTSVAPSLPIKNGIHFTKAQPAESHVVIAGVDGKLYNNDAVIPAQGNFGATAIFTPSAGYQSPQLAIAPEGALAFCNGVDSVIYGGTEFRCAGFMDSPTTVIIYDYSDDVRTADTGTKATIHTTGSGPWIATFYVGSIMPISAFKPYMLAANTKTSTMAVKYYDGDTWEAVSTLSDGTASGGISLAQVGTVSFDSTAAIAKIYNLNGVVLYWYQVTVTAAGADFNAIPTIYYVTTSVPAQQIKDIWDGESRPAYSALIYFSSSDIRDNTTNVSEDTFLYADPSTYLSGNAVNSSSRYLMFGFSEHIAGLILTMGEAYINAVASVVTIEYWNGAAWGAVTGLVDKTLNDAGTVSLSRSGTMSWTYPGDGVEHINMYPFPSHNTTNEINNLYYYRLSFSSGISSTTSISYVRGIPAQKTIKGYSFPLEHQGRTVLCDEYHGERNSILLSAQDTLNVFNGLDSFKFPFGSDDALVAGASLFLRFGSSVQDMLVLFKKGSMWLLEGNGSTNDPFRKRQFAANIGCVAPGTVTTIPVGDLGGGVRRSFVVWESQRGIEIFDGASLMDPLLSNDIRDKFDPRSPTYVGSYLNTGFYDPVFDEYHLLSMVSGPSITVESTTPGDYPNPNNPNKFYIGPVTFGPWPGPGYPILIEDVPYPIVDENSHWSGIYPVNNYGTLDSINTDDPAASYIIVSGYNGGAIPDFKIGTTVIDDEIAAAYATIVPWEDDVRQYYLYANPIPPTTKVYYSNIAYSPLDDGVWAGTILNVNDKIWSGLYGDSLDTYRSIITELGSDSNGKWFKCQAVEGYSQMILTAGFIFHVFDSPHTTRGIIEPWGRVVDSVSESMGPTEWVYSFKYKKWHQIDRGESKHLYGGIPVRDTNGNSYIYGFDNAGYMYRLENGTDFDGNDIVHTLKTGALALNENKISEETTLRMVKVMQVAKTTANSMTATHYGDTDISGNVIGSFVPVAAGKRLASRILNVGSKGPHVHHEFQLSLTTDDQTYGCEPIYIVAYYDGERQDVR